MVGLREPLDVGLYVHVAFCQSKCFYCDFNTYAGQNHLIGRYVDALVCEIERLPQDVPGHETQPIQEYGIGSIFLGGGTPSLLTPRQIAAILDAPRARLVNPAAEITIEANPDDPTVDYLREIRDLGVNRLSFGVQSFDDAMLRRLGRRHDAQTAIRAVERARAAGFDNVSIDLMFALPDQTLEDWTNTLERAIALAPDHLSLYNLTVEPDTAFGAWAAAGTLTVPDDDSAADMYEAAIDRLGSAGYAHYEISNWSRVDSRRDLRAQHNLRYWRNQPYLGVGAGAHSFFCGYRYSDLRSPLGYIKTVSAGKTPVVDAEPISPELERGETMLLGLRLAEGIDAGAFRERFGHTPDELYGPILAELRDAGLIEQYANLVRLTRRGKLLGNEVFYRFLP